MKRSESSAAEAVYQSLCREGSTDLLVDVRSPAEFESMHAEGAVNLPLDALNADSLQSYRPHQGRVFIICKSGNRAAAAIERLCRDGVEGLCLVSGGTDSWVAAGLPVTRGLEHLSLERQVRIAAGTLVVVGVVLSLKWPVFLALAAFVGCGLVFAGVTDRCGMALLLARMPWNRRPSGGCRL